MSTFPTQLPLSGPDYFQVVLDVHHRKHGGAGNLSRLAITFEGDVDISAVAERISREPFVRWLSALRLVKKWFQKPEWKASRSEEPTVVLHQDVDVLDISVRCDPRQEAALRFDLVRQNGRTILLYSWNHILMDARGAEILLTYLGSNVDCVFTQVEPRSAISWRDRLTHIHAMKDYILEHVRTLPTIARNAGQRVSKFNYRNIQFTPEETRMMDAHCDSHQVRLGKSAFYLAATTRTFHEVVAKRDGAENYWIPVPQDKRRKGVLGPVFGNQVSSLFYGIAHARIGTLHEVIEMLSTSMMDQMRARIPESNTIMMDSMRYLPLWLYRHLVKSPTKGRLASFFFSDTGNSLEGLNAYMGYPLVEAVHYPPASRMPAWTCIFMRVQDRQQVVVSYPDATDEDAVLIRDFEHELRKELLGTH